MVKGRSILGAALAETIEADLAQPLPRAQRADRPVPGVTSIMALAGRDEELSKLDGKLAEASATIARLETELATARLGGSPAEDVARLAAELDAARAALPLQRLNPSDVHLSRFSNRHADSYRDAEYVALREEIRAAGGNTQPIGVRPKPGHSGKFELSFGSRRRQACLELGLPVLAIIQEMDEVALFEHMERENRQRKNLRPYEQGVLYQQALDAKLYSSVRKLAEALQIDATGLSRLLAIARLPAEVVAAFASPLDIQAKWGALLSDALEANAPAVLAKAAECASATPKPRPQAVLDALLASARPPKERGRGERLEIKGADGQVATISFAKNAATVAIKNIPADKRAALEKAIRKYLG